MLITSLSRCVFTSRKGVMVVRDDKVLLRSKEQQRGFNFPYQLGTNSEDTPKRADRYELPMQPADIVVIATDGFWDNLFDQKILQLINSWKSSNGGKVDKLAKILAEEAERVSLSKDRTPFQVAPRSRTLHRSPRPVLTSITTRSRLPTLD
jgi:protein phosphatase PTC7